MVSLLSSSSCVSRVLSSNTRKAMILSSRRSYNNVVARPSSSRLLLRFRPATATPSASSLQSSLFSTEAVVPGVGKGKTSTGYVSEEGGACVERIPIVYLPLIFSLVCAHRDRN